MLLTCLMVKLSEFSLFFLKPVVNILFFLCVYFSKVKAVNPVKMVTNGFQILTKNRTYTFVSYKLYSENK